MKCKLCNKEIKNNKHNDSFPLFLNREYKDRLVCDKCNEIVIAVRKITDNDIRKVQFSKYNGDYYAACKSFGEEYFSTALERIYNSEYCAKRTVYDTDMKQPLTFGINPCGSCSFYDICHAKNKGNQAQ